jgi:hypothetical protein
MMTETYPTQPTLFLSEDVYALRINVFENGTSIAFCDYEEEEQHALKICIDDMIGYVSSRLSFQIDSVIGEEGEWVTVLVCFLDNEFRVPFPLSMLDHVVYYNSGEEKKLVGDALRIHPRSSTYKWADKVEILLEEYEE